MLGTEWGEATSKETPYHEKWSHSSCNLLCVQPQAVFVINSQASDLSSKGLCVQKKKKSLLAEVIRDFSWGTRGIGQM